MKVLAGCECRLLVAENEASDRVNGKMKFL